MRKILIITAVIIVFFFSWVETKNVIAGIVLAVLSIPIALMTIKPKKGTWQCHNCAMMLRNCPQPSSSGCSAGGQHKWYKVSGD